MTDLPAATLRDLRNDLIPLAAAAALAYDHVYTRNSIDETPTWRPSDARVAVAHAMASITALYVPSGKAFRQLTKEDLRGGSFLDAGAVLRFPDGRADVSGLLVQSSRLEELIGQLLLMRGLLNELARDYCARRRRLIDQ